MVVHYRINSCPVKRTVCELNMGEGKRTAHWTLYPGLGVLEGTHSPIALVYNEKHVQTRGRGVNVISGRISNRQILCVYTDGVLLYSKSRNINLYKYTGQLYQERNRKRLTCAISLYYIYFVAWVAELVDARDLKSLVS